MMFFLTHIDKFVQPIAGRRGAGGWLLYNCVTFDDPMTFFRALPRG